MGQWLLTRLHLTTCSVLTAPVSSVTWSVCCHNKKVIFKMSFLITTQDAENQGSFISISACGPASPRTTRSCTLVPSPLTDSSGTPRDSPMGPASRRLQPHPRAAFWTWKWKQLFFKFLILSTFFFCQYVWKIHRSIFLYYVHSTNPSRTNLSKMRHLPSQRGTHSPLFPMTFPWPRPHELPVSALTPQPLPAPL